MHSETLDRPDSRSRLKFEDGPVALVRKLDPAKERDGTHPATVVLLSELGTEPFPASAMVELEWSPPVHRRVPCGNCIAGRLAKFLEETPETRCSRSDVTSKEEGGFNKPMTGLRLFDKVGRNLQQY